MENAQTTDREGAVYRVHDCEACCLRLSFAGELDACSVPSLEAALDTELTTDYAGIDLDLSGVQFIDSMGIRLVMSVLRRKRPGAELTLTPPLGGAGRALHVVGLNQLVRFSNAASPVGDAATPCRDQTGAGADS